MQFKDLLVLYRSARFEQDGGVAHLEISNQQHLDALKLCLSSDGNLDDSGVQLEVGDPDNLAVGQQVQLRLNAPRSGLGKLAKNIDHLVRIDNAFIEEPKRYFLIEEKYAKGDQIVPDVVLRYRKLLAFIDLLKQCAAYVDHTASELIFLHEGKFVIPVRYTWAQASKVNLEVLDKLVAFFNDDTHKEQKVSILTNTVLSLVQISALGRRFPTLLTELHDLYNKFAEGYKIFIADFSYDKVRNEFEAFRVEYAGKIHKVFSDIQNQLLTIPVATVIVATTMKSVTSDSTRLANQAVLLGAWVFAILFMLLCANQWKTLSGLNREIVRQQNVMKEDYPTVSPSFEDIFDWLSDRVRLQFKFLIGVAALLIAGLISAHYFYFQMIEVGQAEKQEMKINKAESAAQKSPH